MGLRDKTFTCRDCGRQFLFTVRDQQFYAEHGLTNMPRRCPECRALLRTSRGGGQDRGKWTTDVLDGMSSGMRRTTTSVPQARSKDGGAAYSPDAYVLREVTELSYRCDALAAEKDRLEREKASLLEKVGLLASERDYLKNTLATLGMALPASERPGGPTSRPWWKRIFG